MQLTGLHSNQNYDPLTAAWHGDNFEPFEITFQPEFDLAKISRRAPNLWRYREAMALHKNAEPVSFNEGFTPMISLKMKGGINIFIKQEQLFSTGSYKDRGATVLLSHIKHLGINNVVQDSSGNAGAAIAAYAAMAGIKCNIFLPDDTSPAKILQMKAYGATIIKVPGNRQDTANSAFEAAKKSYYASHCFNPFFFEGTKTFAYEVCEQLNWQSPDAVVVPVGNGTLLIGCFKGFTELANAGIISKIPKLIAVQAKNCNPMARAFALTQNASAVQTHVSTLNSTRAEQHHVAYFPTLAEGIAITNPIRDRQIIDAVIKTKGIFISVSEVEIADAWRQMAAKGLFIEPTSAATIAGVNEYLKGLESEEKIVTLFSGHGLKSQDKIEKILSHA